MKRTIPAILPILLITAFQLRNPNPAAIVDAAVKTRIDATLKGFIDSGKTAGVSAPAKAG